MPALTLSMLGAAAAAWAVLDRPEIGRRVRAIGGNRRGEGRGGGLSAAPSRAGCRWTRPPDRR